MKETFFKNKLVVAYVMITTIFCSGHAWFTIRQEVATLVYPLLIVLLIAIYNELIKPLNLHIAAYILMLLMILATLLVGMGESAYYYFRLVSIISCAFGISLMYDFDKFVSFFLKIMTIVTIVAITCYYINLSTELLSFLPKYTNINDIVYRVGFIYNYIPDVLERNCAMFWEPGLFATYLTVAFLFELLFKNGKASIFRLVLFSVGIITANSSAGFLLLFLCISLIGIKNQNASLKNINFKNFIAAILFIAGFIAIINLDKIILSTSLIENEYFEKLLLENVEESSRGQAIIHNLEMFASSPIFGAGALTVTRNVEHVADTSTSTYIMSIFGVMGILYTVLWIWGVFRQKKFNLYTKIFVTAILIIILNKEPHLQMLFTWILFFYLLKDNDKKGEKEVDKAIIKEKFMERL